MTTYLCKCGRTFQKNTEAGTTGLRMPDYGPGHECYGCPFVCEVATWDPTRQENAVENHECRGSKLIRYGTTAGINADDKCTVNIFTLDFDFLKHIHEFAETLEGFEPDRYFFDHRSASYGADGRYRCTLYPKQNKTGIAAKAALQERFFYPDGSRKDVTPEREKEIILNQIKEAKAMAQGKIVPAGVTYVHGDWRYFVDRREDGRYTAFMNSSQFGGTMKTEVTGIDDFDTFEQAQNALDGFALKRKFVAECSTPDERPEMEQQAFDDVQAENGDSVPTAEDTPKVEQGNDTQKSEADDVDSVDDGAEQPPCDWKNASGDDDGKEDSTLDDEQEPLPEGPDLSLRLPAFSPVFDSADDSLRDMARTLKTKYIESGELAVKIVLNNYNGILRPDPKKCMVICNLKPAKVSTSIHFPADLEITVGQDGRVIVPEDRNHQMEFNEIQPENEVPSGTATVDGKTGIVEDYQEDGQDLGEPPVDGQP